MIWLMIWACASEDIVVPYGNQPPTTILWGPNTFGSYNNTEEPLDTAEDTAASQPETTAYSEGLSIGDTAPNLLANTADGMPWSLYHQTGSVLLMTGNADGVALSRMLEQADDLPENAQQVLLLGNSIYATPATANDADEIQTQYTMLETILLDPTLELVNTWSERAPPKAYLIDSNRQIIWSGFQGLDVNQLSELLSSSP